MEKLPTVETAKTLGLLAEEYEKIKEILGREPNFTELSVYSVMWSEHCSYKNSIVWLKTLPREGKFMLAKAGEENAGLVDIGDGLACCFKIESHNHPSAIEPYQGAATGVGGINRDIFSMGARPIAQLNSLRFGNIDTDRTKWLAKGVVKGIGDYGNAFGIPTVGGEVYFDDCYETNILVNAMSVGIAEVGKTISAGADGPGNPVFIFGSATGKDGIHGAAFASKDIGENAADDLPAVQVGDPFYEKLILEVSMELLETGAIVGMQDMGAAGITCSSSEMSAKSGTGMDVWLDKVPMRQANMHSWEILLSESQERMLVVLQKGKEDLAIEIFKKWQVEFAQIGVVTDTKRVRYYMGETLEADIPSESLVLGGGAPIYKREWAEPAYLAKVKSFDKNQIPDVSFESQGENNAVNAAKFLVATPNIASKRWVYEQYDSMVGTINQSTNFPSDASVVKIKNTDRSLAMAVDCNSRYVHADPEVGAMIAVSEAARNIVCSGGIPQGVTNCLNFGNPYDKGVFYQFKHVIDGMRRACEKFETPVTGGNVSFYNQQSDGTAVFPTPTIGMIGLLEKSSFQTGLSFQKEGDLIYLLGNSPECINSSQYLAKYRKVDLSPAPHFDLDTEFNLHGVIKKMIRLGLPASIHDLSEGGLFIALFEKGIHKNLGAEICIEINGRLDAQLFGEAQSRALVSISKENQESFETFMKGSPVPFQLIGKVKGENLMINGHDFGKIAELNAVYENTLPSRLED
jgi:phosphoribosylformylglycinamidine synthase subunit PurL